jgi:hypothetical protein
MYIHPHTVTLLHLYYLKLGSDCGLLLVSEGHLREDSSFFLHIRVVTPHMIWV